jgi:hypothetical protein
VEGSSLSRERGEIQGHAPHGDLPPSHANRLHFHDTASC